MAVSWRKVSFLMGVACAGLVLAGNRPYEIVRAGRTVDAHAAFADFEAPQAWKLVTEDAVATFSRAQDEQLFGDWTSKIVYRAQSTNGVARVVLQLSEPYPVPADADTFGVWVRGTRFGRGANTDPTTPAPDFAALFRTASGETRSLPLGRIDWAGWHYVQVRFPARDAPVLKESSFVGLALSGRFPATDRTLHFDSLALFKEAFSPLVLKPRAKRNLEPLPNANLGLNTGVGTLPFPVREETILPDVASPLADEPLARFTGGAVAGNDLAALKVTTNRIGRTLVLDFAAPAGAVTELSAGLPNEAAFVRTIDVPYLAYNGNGGRVGVDELAGGRFRLALFDWYRSNASTIRVKQTPKGRVLSVLYLPRTDGTYNPLSERLFITLSPDFAGVLPNIPNPRSPWKYETGRRLWRSHAACSHAEDERLWRLVHKFGMREVTITDHETLWRTAGESYTLRTYADPKKGGDAGEAAYARVLRNELGYSYGPYNNYVEFAPVNACWNPDHALRAADGSLVPAWMRTYALKPSVAPQLCEEIVPELMKKFAFNTAYCDVHTALAPWDRTDYDARVPGAGTFAGTFYGWGETLLLQKRLFNGPVWSEGAHQMFLAGLADGNYGQDWGYRCAERPWLVDFDLLKLHPLETDFGMGSLAMFAPGKTPLEKTYYLPNAPTPAARTNLVDRFLAATLAFGHAGYLILDYLFDPPKAFGLAYGPPAVQKTTDEGLAIAMKSYFMVQAIAARYTQSVVEKIRYVDAAGKLLATADAVRTDAYARNQVCVLYRDGTRVVANGGGARLKTVFEGREYDLPPGGYRAETADGDVCADASDAGGVRADYCAAPDYVYIDGRGTLAERPLARASGTAVCRTLTNGWEVISVGSRPCAFRLDGTWREFTFKPGETHRFVPRAPKATVTVAQETFPTYAFSDPDPVPRTGHAIYPYFRYDGSSETPARRKWTTVVLENDLVKVTVMPEIGGKVWGAVDKATGRDFIYFNHVVKFRDIALRGPWCSGGIEFNFGITGHSPTTATPVDWCVRTNADGSASCFVGATEHINRTTWQVEIRLYPGADHFVTRTVWFNGANLPGPNYNWMTGAYSVRGDPEFFFPGTTHLGHGGDAHPWPIDGRGRNLARYSHNAFGGSKSYHVMNGDSRIFAIWWPQLKMGSYHQNAIYDKYGRKLWLWALSRAGGIWEDLLTDDDGQYMEMQSGRFFTQPRDVTMFTPFKFPTFAPGAVQTFDERWGVTRSLDAFKAKAAKDVAARPVHSPTNFDWSSVYGLYLQGEQNLRTRNDHAGVTNLLACLRKEPNFVPALDALAANDARCGRYAAVHERTARALAMNTYDPEANYLDGLAALAEGALLTAQERLGIAAISPLYRSPALVLAAKARLREGRPQEARATAERVLRGDPLNPDAHLVRIAALRTAGDVKRSAASARLLLVQWPLLAGARWELFRAGVKGANFRESLRGELPGETILDLAGWYEEAGLYEDALALFALLPGHPVARLRAAHRLYLLKRQNEAKAQLAAAERLPAGGAYPFRRESRAALLWAADVSASWKCRYWAAVFLAAADEGSAADALLEKCGEPSDAVFRLYRASRRTGAARWNDLLAAKEAGDSWRVGRALAVHLEEVQDFEGMLAVTRDYTRRYPNAMPLRLLHAAALVGTKRFAEAVDYLEHVTILPAESRGNAHELWLSACAGLARDALRRHDVKGADEALRKRAQWPENLGAGKPFPDVL